MKTVKEFLQKKQNQQKISMITCYDYTSATIIDKTQIDCVLVGDTGGMLMLGHPDTTYTTLDEMLLFTRSVTRGLQTKFIIADLPFLTYRQSQSTTMQAVTALIQAGAHAVKLEGAAGNIDTVKHIVESGVPVMGHLGLTPQHMHALGGFKVQAKTQTAHEQLIQQAHQLADAGCFALVLECIPWQLAKEISEALPIPTIGIGAGQYTDGQVLVLHDMLGLQTDLKPKFVKQYAQAAENHIDSINQYVADVRAQLYPTAEYAYEGNDA